MFGVDDLLLLTAAAASGAVASGIAGMVRKWYPASTAPQEIEIKLPDGRKVPFDVPVNASSQEITEAASSALQRAGVSATATQAVAASEHAEAG